VEEPEFKSCIVTGANAGLGYWTSMELAKLGWTIFMLCRSEEKGKVAKNEIALETSNRMDNFYAKLPSKQVIPIFMSLWLN
jgi:NAD(P)-dependent dehydrogenase (short-subunit alcohol dehydrogenase family)